MKFQAKAAKAPCLLSHFLPEKRKREVIARFVCGVLKLMRARYCVRSGCKAGIMHKFLQPVRPGDAMILNCS